MDDLSRAFRALWWLSSQGGGHGSPTAGLATAFWCARIAERRLAAIATADWTVDAALPRRESADDARVLMRVARHAGAEDVVLELETATAFVSRGARGHVHVAIAAANDADAGRALSHLREALPKQVPTGCRVDMKFWSYQHAALSRDETVDVCRWEDVAANYATRTRSQLDALMKTPAMAENGKLLLWLGPPGTGKTYALRALAWEHRDRATVHYILDPETFLERVDYVQSVFADGEDADDDLADPADADGRARLVVLEDAGELLGVDAKSRVGQGLSRLLNLTDGLPGQATRTRVLITTNEEIGRLHPAVTRPGRCTSLVRFAPLDEREAAAWLASKDREDLVATRPATSTIADLFARLRGDSRSESMLAGVGFNRGR